MLVIPANSSASSFLKILGDNDLFAMYEKNGQPLEVFLGHLIQNKFIRPKVRIYQTNNLYSALVRQSQLEQEVKRIARKGRKTGKA